MFFALLMPFLSNEFKVNQSSLVGSDFQMYLISYSQNNIKFHDTLNDLHGEVPREILPQEFGGDTGKMDHSDVKESIQLFEDYFEEVKQLGQENQSR